MSRANSCFRASFCASVSFCRFTASLYFFRSEASEANSGAVRLSFSYSAAALLYLRAPISCSISLRVVLTVRKYLVHLTARNIPMMITAAAAVQ